MNMVTSLKMILETSLNVWKEIIFIYVLRIFGKKISMLSEINVQKHNLDCLSNSIKDNFESVFFKNNFFIEG